jgi:hypothetical protein
MEHSFELSMEDYTIILNALHYYKKVEKHPNFAQYDEDRINLLRDKMAYQLIPSKNSKPK